VSFLESDDPIAISALQHVSYCPRQYALIHLEQEFQDNVHTMRGHAAHEKVDSGKSELTPEGVKLMRSLQLASHRYGLVGKADVVEFHADGQIYPVEYKYGRRRAKKHDSIQLAAQALCLEEMTGKAVPRGAIYHVSSHKRREVEIDQSLRALVLEAIETVRGIQASGLLPPPATDDRCKECSLIESCQPQLVNTASQQGKILLNALWIDAENDDV
jgi:CRISPR-associated exonuclease Cas4